MGAGQAKLDDTFEIRDSVPPTYLWIDANIGGEENKTNLGHFRNNFKIIPFAKMQDFQAKVQASDNSEKLRVICAASLMNDGYKYIQENERIDRALLFCGNQVRANQLIISYPKIKAACFKFKSVISKVQQWERELDETIIFFNREDITRLNKNTANWLGLTSKDISQPEKAKMNFDTLLCKICKQEEYNANIQPFMQKLKKSFSPERVSRLILEESLTGSCFITKINLLLKCTTSPLKLKLIHFPVHNLFNSIFNFFSGAAYRSFTCKTVINFTDEERRRFTNAKNQILTFSIFVLGVVCDKDDKGDGAIADGDISVIIHVADQKGEISTGYHKQENKLIFNLGNFFQVKEYSQKDRRLVLQLVCFNKLLDVNVAPLKASIYLNQLYMKKQQTQVEGQWKSFILSGMQAEAEEQITKKLEILRKSDRTEEMVKLWLRKISMYIEQGRSQAEILRHFEQLLRQKDARNYNDLILIARAQYFITIQNKDRIRQTINSIIRHIDLIKVYAESHEKKMKLEAILKFNALVDSKVSPQENIMQLCRIEREVARNNEGLISEAYLLLLICKMKHHQILNQFDEAIKTVDSYLWIYEICEGRNTNIFKKMNQFKLTIIQTKNEIQNKEEMERKRELFRSAVPLESLFANDAPLHLELNGLNFTNSC